MLYELGYYIVKLYVWPISWQLTFDNTTIYLVLPKTKNFCVKISALPTDTHKHTHTHTHTHSHTHTMERTTKSEKVHLDIRYIYPVKLRY